MKTPPLDPSPPPPSKHVSVYPMERMIVLCDFQKKKVIEKDDNYSDDFEQVKFS